METTAGRALTWARALVLATVAMLTAVVAHVAGDGRLPSGGALLAITLLTTCAVAPLLARPASALRVVLLTVGAQTGIHLLLSTAAGHHGAPGAAQPTFVASAAAQPTFVASGLPLDEAGRRVGSLVDAANAQAATAHVGAGASIPEPLLHLVHELSGPGAWMALAHLLAAAVVGLWLACGERALWTLLALAWRWVAPVVTAALVPWTGPAVPMPDAPRAARRDLLDNRVHSRRGPPVLAAA